MNIESIVFKSFLTHVYIFKSRLQTVRGVLVQRFITKPMRSTSRIYKMFILALNIVLRLKACVPYLIFNVLVLIFTLFQNPYTCQKGGSEYYVSLFTLNIMSTIEHQADSWSDWDFYPPCKGYGFHSPSCCASVTQHGPWNHCRCHHAYQLSKTFMGAKGLGEPSRGRTLGDEVTLVMAIGKSSTLLILCTSCLYQQLNFHIFFY